MSENKDQYSRVVATIALIAAGVTGYFQIQSTRINQEEYENRFGALTATANLQLWNPEEEGDLKWRLQTGKNVPNDAVTGPVRLVAAVDLTNTGTEPVAIDDVSVALSETQGFSADPHCTIAEDDSRLERCDFPVQIPGQSEFAVYMYLESALDGELQCNSYVEENGVSVMVKTLSDEQMLVSTGAGISAAAFCPDFEPKERNS